MRYLTKSDFVAAQSCATKLYYRKHEYPVVSEDDEFAEMLKDGGFLVGKLAQILHPEGVEVTGSIDEAISKTDALLAENTEITLFEAAIAINHQLVRIDILVKKGNAYRIIEVKSKSFSSLDLEKTIRLAKPYWNKSEYKPYLDDLAYQKVVLQQKYSKASISTSLMLPDTATSTSLDGVVGWFSVTSDHAGTDGGRRTAVSFIGTDDQLEALRKDNVLKIMNLDSVIDPMLGDIRVKADAYITSMLLDQRVVTQISCKCRDCEYRIEDEQVQNNGFLECWGELANPKPHILDLARLGNFNKAAAGTLGKIDVLIRAGKTALMDVAESDLYTGANPAYNGRPLYQRSEVSEFLLESFQPSIEQTAYPLHFIDFETSQMAIPYHADMRPYDKVMFQWSCHTITSEGAEPIHSGWLRSDAINPNIAFAQSLRTQLGDHGTVLTWSPYENTQLTTLHGLLSERSGYADLVTWLETIVNLKKGQATRQLDMHELAMRHYFHPRMGGRTSIKVTLPAVLQSTRSPRIRQWLMDEGLFSLDPDGSITDPYHMLPEPDVNIDGKRIRVADGGGAMRAYQEMVYGSGRNDSAIKAQYVEALKRYCKLDTLAMVIIWEHWQNLIT